MCLRKTQFIHELVVWNETPPINIIVAVTDYK